MKRVMAVLLAAVLSMNAGAVGALELTEEEREQKLKYEEEVRRAEKIRDEIKGEYTYDDLKTVYVDCSSEYIRVVVHVWENTSQNIIDGIQMKYGDDVMVTDSNPWRKEWKEWDGAEPIPLGDGKERYPVTSFYPDVDGDGEVSLSDIQMILRSYLGTETLNMLQADAANVSAEGVGADDDVVIDLNDVQTALNMYMGLQYMYEPDN